MSTRTSCFVDVLFQYCATYFHVPLTQLCAHTRAEPEGRLIVIRSVFDNENGMLL